MKLPHYLGQIMCCPRSLGKGWTRAFHSSPVISSFITSWISLNCSLLNLYVFRNNSLGISFDNLNSPWVLLERKYSLFFLLCLAFIKECRIANSSSSDSDSKFSNSLAYKSMAWLRLACVRVRAICGDGSHAWVCDFRGSTKAVRGLVRGCVQFQYAPGLKRGRDGYLHECSRYTFAFSIKQKETHRH